MITEELQNKLKEVSELLIDEISMNCKDEIQLQDIIFINPQYNVIETVTKIFKKDDNIIVESITEDGGEHYSPINEYSIDELVIILLTI